MCVIKYKKYKFIGEDGSMGLKHGHTYKLAVNEMNWIDRLLGSYPISWGVIAFRPFEYGTPIMPYSSLSAFYENWQLCDTHPVKKITPVSRVKSSV